jgi:hypothetical protein
MTSVFQAKIKSHPGFIACLVFCAAALFFRLGSFGIFEPFESARAESVDRIESGELHSTFPPAIEERLAATLTKNFGYSEITLRLPSAIFALLGAVLTYWLLLPFLGPGTSAAAALFLACSPLWMFHGRQLTSAMPSLLAEIAALGGGMLAVFSDKKSKRRAGILIALSGWILGGLTRGLIVGVAAPAAAVSFAALSSGLFSKSEKAFGPRKITVLAIAAVGVVAAGTFAAAVLLGDFPSITGKEAGAPVSKHTFEFAFEQIVYGWFPLCALAPAAISSLFRPSAENDGRGFARTLAVYALLLEYAAQVISLDVNGIRFAVCALPMAILIALAVEDFAKANPPRRLEAFVCAALLAVLIRDFAQDSRTLLYAYGLGEIPVSKENFKPVIQAGLFSIPAALLILYGFFPLGVKKRPLSVVLTAAAPVSFAVYISLFLMPQLSAHLSSKHGLQMAEKYRAEDEPLALLGKNRLSKDITLLDSAEKTANWLASDDRVFALFPPKDLPAVDRALRDVKNRQVFVLEKASDRFMLAVSKPAENEKNINPLKSIVQSHPFEPAPPEEINVNFDDAVTLLGWNMESEGDKHRLNRGQDLVFTSYWRVDGKIPGDYKMFMHFDGPGGRMHGDHELFKGNFPTSTWQKGDYVKEVFRMKVPLYQTKGEYTVKIGLYNKKGRLKIKDLAKELENALLITKTVVE